MPVPEQAADWLTLLLAGAPGPRQQARLTESLGHPLKWLEADERELADAGAGRSLIGKLRRPDEERLQQSLEWLKHADHHLITLDDALYPPLLKRIPDPPPALLVVGRPEVLLHPQVAIVGSRKATSGGLRHARSFAATLARAGLTVASGLAAGVDGAAHRGCLDVGGPTVAVTGTGPDRVYPARHRDLARSITETGALVSVFPPGTQPLARNFPARNRVISGMSLGTLVVEAGLRSGSLITARLAGEQGREVFALPGSVDNPLARGCHRLIRDGARLVENADEVAVELTALAQELAGEIARLLNPAPVSAPAGVEGDENAPNMDSDPEYEQLLEAVGYDPTPVDDIIRHSRLTPAAVSSMLLMLELDGRITAHAGGRYSRTT